MYIHICIYVILYLHYTYCIHIIYILCTCDIYIHDYMEVFQNCATPITGWFIMESPKKKWMIGGVLPFKHEETSDKRVKTDNLIN